MTCILKFSKGFLNNVYLFLVDSEEIYLKFCQVSLEVCENHFTLYK